MHTCSKGMFCVDFWVTLTSEVVVVTRGDRAKFDILLRMASDGCRFESDPGPTLCIHLYSYSLRIRYCMAASPKSIMLSELSIAVDCCRSCPLLSIAVDLSICRSVGLH